MPAVLALTVLLVASAAQAEMPRKERVISHAALMTSVRALGNRGQSSRERRRPTEADEVSDLVPDSEDDGADVALLATLLSEDDDDIARDSRSARAHVGSLRHGAQLPANRGYVVRDSSRAWGTYRTIEQLTSAFDEVARADPLAPRVRIHDLSLEHGGPMLGHKSHQSGRDVDLTYYQRSCPGACAGRPVAASELDVARQWRLLRYWLERDQAEFIFIDYSLQRPLYERAKSAGATPTQLAQWFQYPRGSAFPAGVIRHAPNHANHVHVRFRCAQSAHVCQGARATWRGAIRSELVTLSDQGLLDSVSTDDTLLELLQE